ncbi:YueI family protein [Enterococcus olivae]
MTDELQKHLDKGLYGAPLLNPDEQKKYLGTFRERCLVSMTLAQMKNQKNKQLLKQHLSNYQDNVILINGALPESLQNSYIQLITSANVSFTIVNQTESCTPDSIGLLVVAEQAVNEQTIDIEQKFAAAPTSQPSDTTEKKSFWKKFFR